MEFIMAIVGVIFVVSITTLYMYLVEQNKIEPHIPTTINKIQRGNFWDAETKQFYKWDKLMELKKLREENDTIQ